MTGWMQVRFRLRRLSNPIGAVRPGTWPYFTPVGNGSYADGRRFLAHLLDPARLGYVSRLAGSQGQLAESGGDLAESKRGGDGAKTAGWRSGRKASEASDDSDLPALARSNGHAPRPGSGGGGRDVTHPTLLMAGRGERG